MKKTELKDVYCVPETDEEWGLFEVYFPLEERRDLIYEWFMMDGSSCLETEWINDFNTDSRKEIPVSKFFDLLEDRIVGWRCLELPNSEEFRYGNTRIRISIYEGKLSISIIEGKVTIHSLGVSIPTSIKTFTELETLIRFLKP